MDSDVESKFRRLCQDYATAQSRLDIARSRPLVTNRGTAQVRASVGDAMRELRRRRERALAPLVRLAYVRSVRSLTEGAQLDGSQLGEIAFLTNQLEDQLRRVESRAAASFDNHVRRQKLMAVVRTQKGVESFVQALTVGNHPIAIEEHARAVLRNVLETVEVAARLSATRAGSYDEAA